ncbi:MAG: AAA family ATPase, partial [Caldilineaceae bacterium]|nr:AAA family ATPase [Caldilineaceae bacterium]
MELTVPELSLVALIGPSGSGKSTFAAHNFLPTEVLSSDALRGVVSDDETDQSATPDAFDVLHYVAGKRLARGKLVVVDATSTQSAARKSLVELARKRHAMTVAIVFNLPEEECLRRNE